jgi:ABC-2 type transport system permease protein
MAQFPTDIYQRGVQMVLTFTVPVVILITVPAKALLGLLAWPWMGFAFLVTAAFLAVSWHLWQYALHQYSSASS